MVTLIRRALASADLAVEDFVSGTSDVSSWRCKLFSSESMIIGSFDLLLATDGLFYKDLKSRNANIIEILSEPSNFT